MIFISQKTIITGGLFFIKKLPIPLVVAALIWGGGFFQVFGPVNGSMLSYLFTLPLAQSEGNKDILIVEVPEEGMGQDQARMVFKNLQDKGAKKIFVLGHIGLDEDQKTELASDLASDILHFIPKAEVTESTREWTISACCDAQNGVSALSRFPHLIQPLSIESNNTTHKIFQAFENQNLSGNEFGINYFIPPDSFAHFNLRQWNELGPPQQLVQERVVLFGQENEVGQAKILIPRQDSPTGVSGLLYQAYVLNTLESNRLVFYPGDILKFIWLCSVGVLVMACLIAFYALLNVYAYPLFLILSGLVLTTLALTTRVIFPPLETLMVVFFVVFIWQNLEQREKSIALGGMWRRLASRVNDRLFSTSTRNREEQWKQINIMISQSLGLHRSIFLQVLPKEHKVKEIISIGCSFADIREPRRDYRRVPYLNAMDENGVVRLERLFLKDDEFKDRETQMLVPLNFAGQIQGFWSLTALDWGEDKFNENKPTINLIADQIAERLYRMRLEESEINDGSSRQKGVEDLLKGSLNLLERRQDLIENVLNRVDTAVVVYDMFGQLLLINDKMVEVLKETTIKPFELSALEFICQVSSQSQETGRGMIRAASFYSSRPSVKTIIQEENSTCHLTVSSLGSVERNSEFSGGVICEITGHDELENSYRMREEISGFLNYTLRNDLSSIVLASKLLGKDNLNQDQKKMVIGKIENSLASAQENLLKIQNFLSSDLHGEEIEVYPLNARESLDLALESLKPVMKERQVTIESDLIKLPNLTMASPKELSKGLRTVLGVLIQDAKPQSKIFIHMIEDSKFLYINLNNEGFGMPNEQIKEFVEGQVSLQSEEFKSLRKFRNISHSWEGDVAVSSKVGAGIRCEVRLKSI